MSATMNSFTTEQLDGIYAFALQLGKDAGNMLMEAARSRFNTSGQADQVVVEKDSSVDIVTKTDEGEVVWIVAQVAISKHEKLTIKQTLKLSSRLPSSEDIQTTNF